MYFHVINKTVCGATNTVTDQMWFLKIQYSIPTMTTLHLVPRI